MKITVTTQGAKASTAIKAHARKRAQKFAKYHAPIHQIEYELKYQRGRRHSPTENTAKIRAYLTRKTLVVKQRDADMYAAIDGASSRMEREIRKEKERLISRTHHRLKNIITQLKSRQ